MPNALAYLVLFGWPLIAMPMIKNKKADDAAILLVIVPYLLIPYGVIFDLPLLPPFDKQIYPGMVAMFLLKRRFGWALLPREQLIKLVVLCAFISPLFTVFSNSDVLVYGPRRISSLNFSDVISMEFRVFSNLYIPFMVGYNFLKREEAHQKVLFYLAVAGLIYSLPCVWEVRMSPQLNRQIYGFFPHSWAQQIREGGFRPIVFLGHGLYVAMFMCMTVISAGVLSKCKERYYKNFNKYAYIYLGVVLVLCKTWAALIYAGFAVLVLKFFNKKIWLMVSFVLCTIVFAYPVLRMINVIPIEAIGEYFTSLSEERGESLNFRFINEEILINKANERSLFGWGGWGRNRVYDEYTGADVSVTDGMWIILYGYAGLFGYFCTFGLLCGSVILTGIKSFSGRVKPTIYTAGICLILSLNLVDLLPNSSLNPLTYLLAGGLFGFLGLSSYSVPFDRRKVPNSNQNDNTKRALN